MPTEISAQTISDQPSKQYLKYHRQWNAKCTEGVGLVNHATKIPYPNIMERIRNETSTYTSETLFGFVVDKKKTQGMHFILAHGEMYTDENGFIFMFNRRFTRIGQN